MTDFTGKAAMVTGAGVGIGYEICRRLAQAGANVALNDIDPDLAAKSAARINAEVGMDRVTGFGLDVADVDAVRQMVQSFAQTQGRLDGMIANAGITNYGSFLDYTPQAFDRLMGVNLRGSYFTAQAAAREMIARGTVHGRILFLSSVTGVQAFPNLGAYGVTKAALRHMAKVVALELGPHGITVNAIAPGAITTERTVADDPNFEENWAQATPAGRSGYSADIAAAALFLASPEAQYVTGHTLIVDGGWTLQSPIPSGHPDLPDGGSKLK